MQQSITTVDKPDLKVVKNIHQKLLSIQTTIKVQKERENKFADFKYRSAEDILGELKPLLLTQNLLLFLEDELVEKGNSVYIQATANLINCENPVERISAHSYAKESPEPKPKMDTSQTTGCCSSYARKYALNGLFCLDDSSQDPDGMNNDKPKTKQKETKQEPQELANADQKAEVRNKIGLSNFAKEMNASGGKMTVTRYNELMEA